MLMGQAARWWGVVLGVLLCTFLICHMLSMFTGMMRRSYALVSDIPEAGIWVMDPAVEYADEPAGLPPTALHRVRGVTGVAWAVPFYSGSMRVRLPHGAFKPVLLIGVDDETLIGAPRDLVAGDLGRRVEEDDVAVEGRQDQAGSDREHGHAANDPGQSFLPWCHVAVDSSSRASACASARASARRASARRRCRHKANSSTTRARAVSP